MCFIHFSSAFDTIWRNALLYKLLNYIRYSDLSLVHKPVVQENHFPLEFFKLFLTIHTYTYHNHIPAKTKIVPFKMAT